VNGRKVNVPSYACKVNDVIEIKNNSVSRQMATKNLESSTSRAVPDWVSLNKDGFKGTSCAFRRATISSRSPTSRRLSNFIPAN
jgi:ribosomal protein S4